MLSEKNYFNKIHPTNGVCPRFAYLSILPAGLFLWCCKI